VGQVQQVLESTRRLGALDALVPALAVLGDEFTRTEAVVIRLNDREPRFADGSVGAGE
jgi:hypothetical protein